MRFHTNYFKVMSFLADDINESNSNSILYDLFISLLNQMTLPLFPKKLFIKYYQPLQRKVTITVVV